MPKITAAEKKIAKDLSHLRESRGLKASWVAKQMQISESYLCCLQGGKRRWSNRLRLKFLTVVMGNNNNHITSKKGKHGRVRSNQ